MSTKTSQSPASTVASSFKLVLISTSVLSAAIVLRLSAPAIADLAECVPSIYNGVVSWMRPPYLYLIINFIIVVIVASSKLQSGKEEPDVSLSPATQSNTSVLHPDPAPPVKSGETAYPTAEYDYDGVVFGDPIGYEMKEEKVLETWIDTCEERVVESKEETPVVIGDGGAFAADATSNKENEYVIPKSTWSFVPENRGSSENSPKPPVSARFSHRRNVKSSPEGVRTVLGVSKPKKQDTLESTWRTITEGRTMPINRHLKKSDTLVREKSPLQKVMKKAETFTDRTNTKSQSPGGDGGGSEKLRRDASLGQDELNRKVEAFIKKFNEEMRLQRQESLSQYREMVDHY